MASPSQNPEANDLRRRGRQRLVGAVVLVLLLVVFVPMVLDSEPRPARQAPALDIPAKEGVAPLPAPAAAPKVTEAKPDPAAAEPAKPQVAAAEVAKVEPARVTAEPPVVAATKPQAEPAKSASARTGFAVQVGAFRDEAKLKQAQGKLQAAGVPSYTEQLDSRGGALTRLRAGPFATREKAEAAQVAIKRAALDGKVIPLP
jgi:DedD protein